jgi:hypothetical protein
MRHLVACAALLAASVPSAARADVTPEVELAAGVAKPVSGPLYAGYYETSLALGLRFLLFSHDDAVRSPWRFGLELAIDDLDTKRNDGHGHPIHRVRGLIGVRVERAVGERVAIFARVLGGLDHYATNDAGGGFGYGSANETAPGLELGVGARLQLGPVVLGAQAGLPLAFYALDDDECSVVMPNAVGCMGQPAYIQTTALDLELLATLGVSF